MKLVFVIFSVQMGGAERVMSTMANYWAQRGHVVSIITLCGIEADFYPLSPNITRITLGGAQPSANILQALLGNLSRILILRGALRKLTPDVVISFTTRINVMTLLATRGLGVPVLVSERCDPSQLKLPWFWKALRRRVYPRAEHVVVQCQQALQNANGLLGRSHFAVIANPVVEDDPGVVRHEGVSLHIQFGLPPHTRIVMGLGRFELQKGFDLLIRAYAKIADVYPDWRLVLVGDGTQTPALQRLVEQHHLRGRVLMPGRARHSRSWLRQADLFVFPSRFEGFPNALLEAMACGLPVVSFDCPSGPGEIIEHGRNGLLVEPQNISALTESMGMLMENAELRHRLASQAQDVLQRFSLARIMSLWESILPEAH